MPTLQQFRTRRFRIGLVLVLLALSLAGGGLLARAQASGGNPLAGVALPSPVRFTGRVQERIDTGNYGYLRVLRDDDASETWVVSVKPRAVAGDHLTIDALGHARRFESKRLGRRFDDLWFAVLRKD